MHCASIGDGLGLAILRHVRIPWGRALPLFPSSWGQSRRRQSSVNDVIGGPACLSIPMRHSHVQTAWAFRLSASPTICKAQREGHRHQATVTRLARESVFSVVTLVSKFVAPGEVCHWCHHDAAENPAVCRISPRDRAAGYPAPDLRPSEHAPRLRASVAASGSSWPSRRRRASLNDGRVVELLVEGCVYRTLCNTPLGGARHPVDCAVLCRIETGDSAGQPGNGN